MAAALTLASLSVLPVVCPCPASTVDVPDEHACCLPESSAQIVGRCCDGSGASLVQPATPEAPPLTPSFASSGSFDLLVVAAVPARSAPSPTAAASPPLVLRI